jgi:phosphoesterase RecJ-like protein
MLASLLDALSRFPKVLLSGPQQPDGDSIGACLALQRLLARRAVPAVVAGEPGWRYADLPGAGDMVPDQALDADFPAVVILDGDRFRLAPGVDQAFRQAALTALVDHHASSTPEGYDLAWIEPGTGSTCEMILRELVASGEPLDEALVAALYVGIVFDTGGFRYSSVTPDTHLHAAHLLRYPIDHAAWSARVLAERSAAGLRLTGRLFERAQLLAGGRLVVASVEDAELRALGAQGADLEGVVEGLVHVVGCEVALLLVECPSSWVKVSLRSRAGLDLVPIARGLAPTGGGHAKAAGAMVPGRLDAVRERVVQALVAALGD